MAILVLNCGSSSLKFALVDPDSGERPLAGLAERLGTDGARLEFDAAPGESSDPAVNLPGADHTLAVTQVLTALQARGLQSAVEGVGHRVVHGGEAFTESTLVTDEVEAAIAGCSHLAPLHNPANLLGLRAARAAFPELPQVAVFDTAFHQTMPARAYRYAVPDAWYTDHGVRRYGFHGTSHRYVAGEAARRLGKPLSELNLITAHLGNGCSAAAIAAGESQDTTMGLTPLAGLVMGTRSGNVDPGLVAFMGERLGVDGKAVTGQLNKASGLLGISGLSNDMRTLLDARGRGHEGATLAIELFCYRLASELLALAAALKGLDALVFTGGIGEHAAPIREETLARLWPLGASCDARRNVAPRDHDGHIEVAGERPMLVIPTDEERMIARDTRAVVAGR